MQQTRLSLATRRIGPGCWFAAALAWAASMPAVADTYSIDLELSQQQYVRYHHGMHFEAWADPTPFVLTLSFDDTVNRYVGENGEVSYSFGAPGTLTKTSMDGWAPGPASVLFSRSGSAGRVVQYSIGEQVKTSFNFSFDRTSSTPVPEGSYHQSESFWLWFDIVTDKDSTPEFNSENLRHYFTAASGARAGEGGFYWDWQFVEASGQMSADDWVYGTAVVTGLPPVPEPQTWALMGGGLALLGWRARRRLST